MKNVKLQEGWKYIKISDLTDVITGGTPSTNKSEYWNGGNIPWLPSGDCKDSIIDSATKFITEEGLRNSAAKLMPINTVIIALTGATTGKVGILNIEASANQSVTGIVPNEKFVPQYIFYYLRSIREKILHDSYGGAQKHISQGYVKDIMVVLPPLETQKKIVEILDKAEKALEKRKEAIKLLDELVKSRFIEMFGDPIQNSLGWELKPLLEGGSCKNGMNFGIDETGIELQYLGVGDFKDLSKIDDVSSLGKVSLNQMPSKEYILQDGDIVFVRSNGNKALVGRCLAVYPKGILTTYSGFCIRYRKTDEKLEIPYLLQVLKTDSMRKNMAGRGANIQNLNQQILGQLMIPIPPLELQNQFADFVNQVDKLKFEMEKSLKELEDNFNSLMQKAFNGELFN